MEIIPVQNKSDLKAFVELPYQLYKDDRNWVAPLRDEQMAQFEIKKNPMLEHCEYALFLAKKDGQVVGRISAFLDRLALEHWKEPIGLFGSFECEKSDSTAKALLQAGEKWLKDHNMKRMRGPWSFASQEWGLVYKGFTPPPMIMAPYNPPWYNEQMELIGLKKVKDLIIYYIDTTEGYVIPERILELTDRIQKRYQVKVRPVNMKDLTNDVITIVDLANKSIADNWGFYPVTEAEGRAMARDMKMIVNPKALIIAEDAHGRPIGFAMSLPNVNKLIKGLDGRLFPFGLFKILFGLKKLHEYRMWALGVIPEYQGCAIDTLLYRATHEALNSPTTRLEINYVLEDNHRMNNALMKLGAKPLRVYRIYEKDL